MKKPIDVKKIKVVAFDCDGVMFDTKDINRAYYNSILEHFGKSPMTESQFRYTHTHTVRDSLLHIFPDETDDLSAVLAYRNTIRYFSLIQYMIIEPHLKPLIEKIRPAYKIAIATNRSDTMSQVLEEHGLVTYFDMVVTAVDVERAKPHPDQLLKIMREFKVNAEEAIFIGDSELDQMAAAAIDMPFVAYGNPVLDADFHISSLEEMQGILEIHGCERKSRNY